MSNPFAARNDLKIKQLRPQLQPKVLHIVQQLEKLGYAPVVAEAKRTKAQQAEKVKKGYSKTMRSYHLIGMAADIVNHPDYWDGPASKRDYPFWADYGALVASEGLTWGGKWKFWDPAHLQMDLTKVEYNKYLEEELI